MADRAASALTGCLRLVGPNFHRHVVKRSAELCEVGRSDLAIQIHCPQYVAPDPNDAAMTDRILNAFRLAKQHQRQCDPVFLPSSLWQRQLDDAFGTLSGDRNTSQYFLANFGVWDAYTGIEHTNLVRHFATTPANRRYFERNLMPRLIGSWIDLESQGRPVESLRSSRHGNLVGAIVNGHFVTLNAALDDTTARLIAPSIGRARPVIAELGAGYAGLFKVLSEHLQRPVAYIDFDLPETLCCASFYLMKQFPQKRFLLYGESEFTAESLDEFDIILMPSFEILKLPDDSVDLFLNRASLGEMHPPTTERFIAEISRTAAAFWHSNHEFIRNKFDDGSSSLRAYEYPVDREKFQLVARGYDYLSVLHFLMLDPSDSFWYLFRSRSLEPNSPG